MTQRSVFFFTGRVDLDLFIFLGGVKFIVMKLLMLKIKFLLNNQNLVLFIWSFLITLKVIFPLFLHFPQLVAQLQVSQLIFQVS
jgi:hypothetical protein